MEKVIIFILLLFTLDSFSQSTKDLEKALYACDSSYIIQGQHLQKSITSDSLKSELLILKDKKINQQKRGKIKIVIKSSTMGIMAGLIISLFL